MIVYSKCIDAALLPVVGLCIARAVVDEEFFVGGCGLFIFTQGLASRFFGALCLYCRPADAEKK